MADETTENLPVPSLPNEEMDAVKVGSIFDFLPPTVQKWAQQIPAHYWAMSEIDLKKHCYPDYQVKRSTESRFNLDEKIRISFWEEFEASRADHRKMSIVKALEGIVQYQYFYQTILKCPERLAWILTPPPNYKVQILDLLNRGLNRIYEIIEMPLTRRVCRCHWECKCGPKKKHAALDYPCKCNPECICPVEYDPKIADVILKAYERIELRAKGSIPQVINQKTLSVNVHEHTHQKKEVSHKEPETLEDIERRLIELRAKASVLTGQVTRVDHNLEVLPPEKKEINIATLMDKAKLQKENE